MYAHERKGAGFGPTKEIEFASGASNDPYGFRPTDVIVDRDGSLVVTDWADGQRPKRGRGRIYRIQAGAAAFQPPTPSLDSESYHSRIEAQTEIERRGRAGVTNLMKQLARLDVSGRLHAVWVIARADDSEALFQMAKDDPDPRLRAQAVRAIADLFDPIFVEHTIAATRGNPKIAKRLAALDRRQDARVMLDSGDDTAAKSTAMSTCSGMQNIHHLRVRYEEIEKPLACIKKQDVNKAPQSGRF